MANVYWAENANRRVEGFLWGETASGRIQVERVQGLCVNYALLGLQAISSKRQDKSDCGQKS